MADPGGLINGQHGTKTEEQARAIAAQLGLSDFVYRAELVAHRDRNREPGDAPIYANGFGAIVQVKSRDPEVGSSDSPQRAQAWIDKSGRKAVAQASGTRRELVRLQQAGSAVLALPVRASHLSLDDQRRAGLVIDMDVSAWPTVVVIDHPSALAAQSPLPADVFWITLEDWHQLHQAIRSTTGVLTYIQRVLATDPTPRWTLGTERHRYAAFVDADKRAADLDSSPIGFLDWNVLDDPIGVRIYRDVMQHLWPESGELPAIAIDQYRLILEHLDAVAPGAAAGLGNWIHAKRQHLRQNRSWSSGMSLDHDRLTVYACDHRDNYTDLDHFDAELAALLATRAREVTTQGRAVTQACGIGVLQDRAGLDYRYVFMRPPLDLTPGLTLAVRQRHGAYDAVTQSVKRLQLPPRNAPCPCGSGQKVKRCHGTP